MLQKCLKGEEKEIVQSLLIQPGNFIDQLQFRFGRPEQLHSQLKVKSEGITIY